MKFLKTNMSVAIGFYLLAAIFLITSQTALAQFTISIPKIPKIKKNKDDQSKPNDNQTNQNTTVTTTDNNQKTDSRTSVSKTTETSQTNAPPDWWLSVALDDIKKVQDDVEEYTPEGKLYLARRMQDDYLLMAVSKKAREKWAKDKKINEWRVSTPGNKLDIALDALSTSAATKLSLYKPKNVLFQFRNPVAEKLVMDSLAHTGTINAGSVKVFKIGTDTAGWNIQKDDSGLPSYRYKFASVYFQDTSEDHLYCHVVSVTVKQDYAGGGTYSTETYRSSANEQLFGCPATAK
ncbi:MAG: hypothetical protein ABI954_07865 [Pyrinomonadaceae bacterium]